MRGRAAFLLAGAAVVGIALAWRALAPERSDVGVATPAAPAPETDRREDALADLASNRAFVPGRVEAAAGPRDDAADDPLGIAATAALGEVELRGVARLSDGRPAREARLTMYFATRRDGGVALPWQQIPPRVEVPTDAAGAFAVAVERQPEGTRVEVAVSALSHGAQGRVDLEFPDASTAPVDLGVVVLELQQLVCTGDVVDTAGAPVEGASVALGFGTGRGFSMRGGGVNEGRSDALGRWELRGPLEVEKSSGLRLLATKPGFAGDPVAFPGREGHATIVLRPVAPYRGLVALPEVVDPRGLSVESVLAGGVVVDRDFLDDGGVFEVGVPHEGGWSLRLTGTQVLNEVALARAGHAPDPFTVASVGAPLLPRWELAADASVCAVTLRSETGAPIELFAVGLLESLPPRRRAAEQTVVFTGPSIEGVVFVEFGRWARATFTAPAIEVRLSEPIEVEVEVQVDGPEFDGLVPAYVWVDSPIDPLSSFLELQAGEVVAGRAPLTLPFAGEWTVHAKFLPPDAPSRAPTIFGSESDVVGEARAYLAPGPVVTLRY